MTDVYDLDAAIEERKGEPFHFKFGGERYRLPSTVDMRVLAVLEGGDVAAALMMMLGDEQWERMLAAKQVFDLPAMLGLLERWAAHSGLDLGEASGSVNSSATTVKPSKRTSNGTTPRTSARSAPQR